MENIPFGHEANQQREEREKSRHNQMNTSRRGLKLSFVIATRVMVKAQ